MKKRLMPVALGLALIVLTNCRSRGRTPVEDPYKTVEIEMVDVSGTFKPGNSYVYRLSQCGTEVQFLELDSMDILRFRVKDIDSGAKCRLDVMDTARVSDPQVKWGGGEPGIIYWTKNLIIIDRGNRGQLKGVAMLSPGILGSEPSDQNYYRLQVPVSFGDVDPLTLDLATVAAAITCKPALEKAGVFQPQEKAPGYFQFIIVPPYPTQKMECSRITVSVDGAQRFRGEILPGQPFQPEKGGLRSLGQSPIKLEPISDEEASGVVVVIKSGECKDGEIFDPAKGADGECRPASEFQ